MPHQRPNLDRLAVLLDRGRTVRWCYTEADRVARLGAEIRRVGRQPSQGDFLALLDTQHEMLLRMAATLGMVDALEPPRSWWGRLRVRVARWVLG